MTTIEQSTQATEDTNPINNEITPTAMTSPAPFWPNRAVGVARHVGRVGALAVALGIGAAIASGVGMGVAWADDTAGSTATSTAGESSQQSGPSAGPGNKKAERPGARKARPAAATSGAPDTAAEGAGDGSDDEGSKPATQKHNRGSRAAQACGGGVQAAVSDTGHP